MINCGKNILTLNYEFKSLRSRQLQHSNHKEEGNMLRIATAERKKEKKQTYII